MEPEVQRRRPLADGRPAHRDGWRAHRRRATPDRSHRTHGWPRSVRVSRPAPTGGTRRATPARATTVRRWQHACGTPDATRVANHSTKFGGVPVRSPPINGTSRRYMRPLTNRTSIVASGAPSRANPSPSPSRGATSMTSRTSAGHRRRKVRRVEFPRPRHRAPPTALPSAHVCRTTKGVGDTNPNGAPSETGGVRPREAKLLTAWPY